MGSSSPALSNMQFLVLLSAVAVAFASPIPEEGAEAPVALAYVHDATGDVADDAAPAAVPYVHDATGDVSVAYVHDVTGDAVADAPAAVAYVHDVTGDIAVAAAPVAYAGYPYAGYPFAYAGYPYAGFPVAAFAGACLNNLGFAVPCAQL